MDKEQLKNLAKKASIGAALVSSMAAPVSAFAQNTAGANEPANQVTTEQTVNANEKQSGGVRPLLNPAMP